MKELERIESRENFPTPDRPMYIINLMKSTATFYLHGKEMNESACGDMIIRLINALNDSEKQIKFLLELMAEVSPYDNELEDYLENYPVEDDYEQKYKMDDLKEALFHSMMKKDDKRISHYINQILVLENKIETVES